jgi:hypothetical protein
MFLHWETWGIQGQAAKSNNHYTNQWLKTAPLLALLCITHGKNVLFLSELIILWLQETEDCFGSIYVYVHRNMHINSYNSVGILWKKKKPIEIPPFSIIQVSSFHSFYSFLSQRKLVVFLFPKLHRRFIIYVWKKKDKKTHRLYFGNLTDFLVSNILRWFFYI